MASRVEPRDYADVAAALEYYTPAQLIRFARRLDAGLTGQDFADAGLRLDQIDDRAFAEVGLSERDVVSHRERLTAWPRTALLVGQESQPENPTGGHQEAGSEPVADATLNDPEAEP